MWPIDGERETEPVGPESRLRLCSSWWLSVEQGTEESIDWAPIGFSVLQTGVYVYRALLLHGNDTDGRANMRSIFSCYSISSSLPYRF